MIDDKIKPGLESSAAERAGALPEEAAPTGKTSLMERNPGVNLDVATSSSAVQLPPPPDPTVVKTGAEFGMTRFCEQSFINPESATLGSQALLKAFDDSGLWLASLVQPMHLVAELRQRCCLLTRVVITQWTRQGETHKLVRLAEALMDAQPPVLTHEAGQIMALMASLLGILRPTQAPRWLEASRPLLRDSVDPHLLKDAAKWVAVGQMLVDLPQEDRVFWNRRLREPENDWDWESPEALDALRRLAPLLPVEHESLALFQEAVPRCWWDLWRGLQLHAVPAPQGTKGRRLPAFVFGWVTGIACMLLVGWWMQLRLAADEEWVEVEVEQTPQLPTFSFHAVDMASVAPSLPEAPVTTLEGEPKTKRILVRKKEKTPSLAPVPPQMQVRLDETAKIATEFPEVGRLYNLVKTGNLREAEPHIHGRTTVAAQGSKRHRALLRWLMLDPPQDPAVRELVSKVAVRLLDSKSMYETLQLCLYPGSPNLQEARECASLLLALSGEGLNEVERQSLAAATTSK